MAFDRYTLASQLSAALGLAGRIPGLGGNRRTGQHRHQGVSLVAVNRRIEIVTIRIYSPTNASTHHPFSDAGVSRSTIESNYLMGRHTGHTAYQPAMARAGIW